MRTLAARYLKEKQQMGAVTAATACQQRGMLRSFTEFAPTPERATRGAVLRWRESISHLAPATQRTRYSAVRGFCHWLTMNGHVRRDPCGDIPAPKVPRPRHRALTDSQVEALVGACEDETDLLIVTLGLRLGLRRAEMAFLALDHIDFSARTIDVRGKGSHWRTLPLPADVATVIDRYLDLRRITGGPLLRQRRYPNRGVQPVWVGRRFTELCWQAGIKSRPWDGVSTHASRHAFATGLWRRTGDAALVAAALGHADLSQVPRYVKADDVEKMRAAMDP